MNQKQIRNQILSFYFRILTFLYLPVHNFWLLLCPEKLSYDWQMGSVPLIHISNITNDPSCIVIPLFYGTLLSFILILLQRLKPEESKSTWKTEEEYNTLIGTLNNFFLKFISIINYLKTSPFKMKKSNVSNFTLIAVMRCTANCSYHKMIILLFCIIRFLKKYEL